MKVSLNISSSVIRAGKKLKCLERRSSWREEQKIKKSVPKQKIRRAAHYSNS